MKKLLLNVLILVNVTFTFAQASGTVSTVSGTPTTAEVGITQNYSFTFTPQPLSSSNAATYEILYWTIDAQVSGNTIPGHINNITNNTVVSIFGNWEKYSISTPKTISIPIAFGNLANRESKIKIQCWGKFYKTDGSDAGTFNTVSNNFEHSVTVYKVNQPTLSLTNQFLECCAQNVNICANEYGDANSFSWSVSGGNIVSGQGSSCITVTPNATGSLTASCIVKRTIGLPNYTASNSSTFSRSPRTADFTVLYPEFPNNSQPVEFICKGVGRQMEMPNQCGLSSINWVANGCSITGQNTINPTITPASTVPTGSAISVFAVVTFTGGCTATTPTKTFTIFDSVNPITPAGYFTYTSNTGDVCTAEIFELGFVSTNGFNNGTISVSPDFIFGPGDEIHYDPSRTTRISVCYKNLCTGQNTCKYYNLYPPAPCYTGDRISNSIIVSPNPADDYVNIVLPYISSGQIQVLDQNNFEVYSSKFVKKDEIDIKFSKKINSGIYIVKIITENKIFTEKLIIN